MSSAAENYQKHFASQFDLNVLGTSTELDTATQIRIVDDLIDAHTSAIVLAPTDSKALVPAVIRAINAGVIVIAIDNPLDEADLDAAHLAVPFVGPDNRKGAQMVANYLATKLNRGDEVGIIEGLTRDRNAQQRTEGFRSAMDAAGMKVVAVAPGDYAYAKGEGRRRDDAGAASAAARLAVRQRQYGDGRRRCGSQRASNRQRVHHRL